MSLSKSLLSTMTDEQIAAVSPKLRWLFRAPPRIVQLAGLAIILCALIVGLIGLVS